MSSTTAQSSPYVGPSPPRSMAAAPAEASPARMTKTKTLLPATDADQALLSKILHAMPFAGSFMAPYVWAVAAEPLPPLNSRGGRDVEGWTAVYCAEVQPDWVNGGNGLHGAAAAWLVDMVTGTSFSRLHTDTWNAGGPSIAIDMAYYNPAPPGMKLRIETVIDRMGGQLSTARCDISEWGTGRRIATGLHTTMRRRPTAAVTAKL